MRLKARFKDVYQMQRVLALILKTSKHGIIRFSNTKVSLMAREHLCCSSSCSRIWCEIDRDCIFDQYSLDGNLCGPSDLQSNCSCDIVIEVNLEDFLKALRSGNQNSSVCYLKLTKRENICLSVQLTVPLDCDTRMRVTENASTDDIPHTQLTHNIAVKLIDRRFWDQLGEPQVLRYDASVSLNPQLKRTLRNLTLMLHSNIQQSCFKRSNEVSPVLDRLKLISPTVKIGLHGSSLLISVKTDSVSIEGALKNVQVLERVANATLDTSEVFDNLSCPSPRCSVNVDCKEIANFLQASGNMGGNLICNIRTGEQISLFLISHHLKIQFTIPC
ncbi:hypothetical protein ACOME3_006820 [Neoechinorhynchus agilis]